jgi:DNA-binding HxlR family transcriptional regulator
MTKRRSSCPVSCTLDLVGDRWTLLVVRDLLVGKTFFDDFRRSDEGIATNILSARLKGLAEKGLVRSVVDESDRRRWRYELTDRGRHLGRLVGELAQWGLANLPGTRLAKAALPLLRGS